ncbi:MAG: imidazolonepropionase-like amidohydrolase [Myxococcota bacterium]|jgi:imidazolonepropionase-like amidohydrolase
MPRFSISRTTSAVLSRWYVFLAATSLLLASCGGAAVEASDVPETGDVAFVNVSVLPMDSERVLEGQTVIVEDGRITYMGATGNESLDGVTTTVDGEGKYLLPGLSEMHAHVPGDNAPRDLTEDILFLYVANGITTMRGMLGAPGQLVLREEIASGDVIGPRFIVGAPSANGNSTPTPEAAEAHVRESAAAGYDFMKIHPGIPLDAWDRMVEVAGEVGLTFGGHVPLDVGIEHAIKSGTATVDHLDGYLQGSISEEMRTRMAADLGVIPTTDVLAAVDQGEVDRLVALSAEHGTWQVPTMYLWENFYAPVAAEDFLTRPGMEFVPQSMRERWVDQKRDRPGVSIEVSQEMANSRLDLLRALYEAGVPILMGTDAPQMFNVPGFSLHHEIEVMARAMPNFAVLEAGTKNVARFVQESLGVAGDFGVVAVGNRADLILSSSNPITNLGTIAQPAGVVLNGRWLPRAMLDERLAELAAKYAN